MAQLPLGASATALPSEQAGSSRSLIIVTMLFFMWGLLTSLNDVLIGVFWLRAASTSPGSSRSTCWIEMSFSLRLTRST